MNKTLIKNIIKNNKYIYLIYRRLFSTALRIASKTIKIDENLVLLVVYGGKKYDDSPRFIYEYMKGNKRFDKYKMKWAFINPNDVEEVPEEEKIRIDTIKYFITALKAKYWLTNSSVSRGLNFQNESTINILTQHGMAGIKKIGYDLDNSNESFGKNFQEKFDYIVIEGKEETSILERAWGINEAVLLKTGLPRNDQLWGVNKEQTQAIKKKLGIPLDKKVILYAPTYREYQNDITKGAFLEVPISFKEWEKAFSDQFVMLITAHYEVQTLWNVPYNDFVIDAFSYPYINDLLMVSDILISDYSSVIFDYSILERPIISYAYDYEVYKSKRGIYDGYEDLFYKGICKTEAELMSRIKNMNYSDYCEYTKQIKERFIIGAPNASKVVADMLFLNDANEVT